MTDDRPPQPFPGPADYPAPGPGAAGSAPGTSATGPGDPGPSPSGPGTAGPAPGIEPPPLTAFAWRSGLVRPVQGRVFAGVCGAFARATNTDPVLWRVVLAVLTIFAGIGALIYLIAWLILPADGDTASPIEALAGRGQSRTSTIRTIIGTVIVVIALAGYVSEPFRATPLVAIVLLGAILLLLLRDQSRGRARPVWSGPGAPAGFAAATTYPAAPGVPPAPPGAPAVAPPPFAPYGPFVTPPPTPPAAPPTFSSPPPKPPKPRSRLGLLTFSVMLLVLGGLAIANLAGANVAPVAFVAAALTVVGLGLIVGAWIGRSYWLIPLGLVLSLALGGGWVANNADRSWPWLRLGDVTWAPPTVSAIRDSYRHNAGDGTLDLSEVDFSGTNQTVNVTVQLDLGSLRIILPPDVDTTIDATVDLGDAKVFHEEWDGVGSESRTVTDLGDDGAGGGRVHITAIVHAGDLEVHR
jgi:phage shock protein PspC (stress-responsive transcriptional regulator)